MTEQLQAALTKVQPKARHLAILAVGTLATGLAMAGAPADPFAQAITEVTDKVNDYGPALVGLGVVSVIFFVALKYVKKIVGAA